MIVVPGKIIETPKGVWVKLDGLPEGTFRETAAVGLIDKRQLSYQQRAKAWALISEIADWSGTPREDLSTLNEDLKTDWLMNYATELEREAADRFSLSDCDMSTAARYITYLVDFCVRHDVPTKQPLGNMAEDIERYVYACMMNKVCAVCRRRSDLHHVDRVGMGRNRDDIIHTGMRALPLCREHHQEAHQHGDDALCLKYHLEPIVIDEKIAKKYGLKAR